MITSAKMLARLCRNSTLLRTPLLRRVSTKASPCGPPPTKDWNRSREFFEITDCRFLADEARMKAQQRVNFDMNELARVAARATGASHCKDVKKVGDMVYQKVYSLTMDNGREVVAKVPLPHVSLPHLTCASQVASMDFARSVLQLPTPNVLAWNSHVDDNPVGAEYVLVDKFPGVSLKSVWGDLSPDSIHNLCVQLASYQDNMLSKAFRQIGALYYADQTGPMSTGPLLYTDSDGREIQDTRFTVGPVIGQEWVLQDRCKLECDRGPWNSTLCFLKAIVYRELEAVEKAPRVLQSLDVLVGPSTYRPTKEKKRWVGQMYLKVLEHIIPLHSPVETFRFWHNRLSLDTIFVDPHDHYKIVGLTGWEHTQIAPLFKQRVWSNIAEWDAVMDVVDGDDEQEFLVQSEEGTTRNWLECHTRNHATSKKLLMLHKSPDALRAKRYQESKAGVVVGLAEKIFDEEEAKPAWRICKLRGRWGKKMPYVPRRKSPFPIKMSRRLERKLSREWRRWEGGFDLMLMLNRRLGKEIEDRGVVNADDYKYNADDYKRIARKLRKLKRKFVAEGRVYEHRWPFDA